MKESGSFAEVTHRIVAEHHERADGSGYPLRRCGEHVSRFSQVVAIVDAYDDLVMGREQAPLPPVDAFSRLRRESEVGRFDSELVEGVVRRLGVYPVGSLVELNSGERGVVIAPNRADGARPTVRIISSRTGLDLPYGPIVSLAETDPRIGERRILQALNPLKERIDLWSYFRLAPSMIPGR